MLACSKHEFPPSLFVGLSVMALCATPLEIDPFPVCLSRETTAPPAGNATRPSAGSRDEGVDTF